MSRTQDIVEEWQGYYLNNCLPLDHSLRQEVKQKPTNVDWTTDLVYPLRHEPITYKFLRIGKKYFLDRDIESEEMEILAEPILINAKRYDYGNFSSLLPQHKITEVCSFYKEEKEARANMISYLTLPNELTTRSKINKIPSGRRTDAIDFVITRAIEIDKLMPGRYTLEEKVNDFFRNNIQQMTLFEKSGAIDINEEIERIISAEDDHWLKTPIPVALDEQGRPVFKVTGLEIMRVFGESVEPVTQSEINSEFSRLMNS